MNTLDNIEYNYYITNKLFEEALIVKEQLSEYLDVSIQDAKSVVVNQFLEQQVNIQRN